MSPAEQIQQYWEKQDETRTAENAEKFPVEAVMWYLNDKRECLGADALSPEERVIVRLREFRTYGPGSYFQYQIVEEFPEILRDLRNVGCPELAELLEQCMRVILKGKKVPRSRDKFDMLVEKLHGDSECWQEEVERILDGSDRYEQDFWEKLEAHTLAHAKSHDIPATREAIAVERLGWLKQGKWMLPFPPFHKYSAG